MPHDSSATHGGPVELAVELVAGLAGLAGVIAVLHARHIAVEHVRYVPDGRRAAVHLVVDLDGAGAERLARQIERRVDVMAVQVLPRTAQPGPAAGP